MAPYHLLTMIVFVTIHVIRVVILIFILLLLVIVVGPLEHIIVGDVLIIAGTLT